MTPIHNLSNTDIISKVVKLGVLTVSWLASGQCRVPDTECHQMLVSGINIAVDNK